MIVTAIYSADFDAGLKAMALRILKTPYRAPRANAFCERLIGGTVRRECLDFLIPLSGTYGEFSKNGLRIITGGGHIPASDLASPIRGLATSGSTFANTAFRPIIEL
jgi:hypothetical protein